eukprot:14537794-Alexandrium_andersonii.AAC.1
MQASVVTVCWGGHSGMGSSTDDGSGTAMMAIPSISRTASSIPAILRAQATEEMISDAQLALRHHQCRMTSRLRR